MANGYNGDRLRNEKHLSPNWRRFGFENRAFQSKHSVILDVRLHPYKVIHIHTLTSISVCNYMS